MKILKRIIILLVIAGGGFLIWKLGFNSTSASDGDECDYHDENGDCWKDGKNATQAKRDKMNPDIIGLNPSGQRISHQKKSDKMTEDPYGGGDPWVDTDFGT